MPTTLPSEGVVARAVVLGASNVMRGLPSLVNALRATQGGPLDLLMATGHGRSYGMGSRVFGRALPAILASGLWPALEERPPMPTLALVTDVGNDILYGAPPERIVGWVEEAVHRVLAVADRVVLTGLPLAGIDALGRVRYLTVRSVLFPGCRVPLAEARRAAHTIDGALRELAGKAGARFVEPDPAWYGLDPIHVRRGARIRAWDAVLAPRRADAGARPRSLPLAKAVHLRLRRPAYRRLFGFEQRTPQPATILRDGTRVSLY